MLVIDLCCMGVVSYIGPFDRLCLIATISGQEDRHRTEVLLIAAGFPEFASG
jgi:hypothetical protein